MYRLFLLSFACFFFLSTASAWAIDGYKDRRGPFLGFGFGGGPGSVHIHDDAFRSGLEDGGDLGFHLHLIAGGGVNERLTLGAELNSWLRTVSIPDQQLNHQHWSLNASGDLFLIDGFYLSAGLGLAYSLSDASRDNLQTHRYQEMGLATKAGTGYEFFLNGTVAAGLRLSYTRHFYQNIDFDTFHGAFTLRWY